MKYLILCEGLNEVTIINILLDNNLLRFTRDDLIGLEIYHARQLVPFLVSQILQYNSNVLQIIRIGDKLSDELKIPFSLEHILSKQQIINCRTHPELEILLIINQNLFSKYNKQKSNIRAKDFAKENILFNGEKYNNTSQFWYDYYAMRPHSLVNDIKKCSKIGKNKKNEIYLVDLLK